MSLLFEMLSIRTNEVIESSQHLLEPSSSDRLRANTKTTKITIQKFSYLNASKVSKNSWHASTNLML